MLATELLLTKILIVTLKETQTTTRKTLCKNMGSSSSTETKAPVGEIHNDPNSFHVLEFHIPSAAGGISVVIILIALYFCLRRMKRQRKLARQLEMIPMRNLQPHYPTGTTIATYHPTNEVNPCTHQTQPNPVGAKQELPSLPVPP